MASDRSPLGRALSPAIWLPAIYFAVSALWIAVSDEVLFLWVSDPAEVERWGLIKGWGYVAVTALAFAWGLHRVQARHRVATAAVDQLEQRARALVESSPDAIVIQEGLRIAYANPAAARLLGAATTEALVGRSVLDVVDPSERAGVEARSTLAEEDRPFPALLVRRMRRLDGTPFRAEVALARFPGMGERALQVTMRDVTEAWRLQEEVRRINRALRTLGAVDEALLRAASEGELMEEVCRIAVEEGGYRLAWVGLAGPGGAGGLRPVARHGLDPGMAGALEVSWADATRPESLAATAFRTGQPAVLDELASAAHPAAHRAVTQRLGLGAAIALPMNHGPERLGALSLVAGDPGAFDPAVVQLLRQLVDDLAFGLVALRVRATLASERAFLDAILENAGVLIGVVDRAGVLVRANAEYERVTGWPVRELVGRPVWERLATPEQAARFQRAFPEMWRRAFPLVVSSEMVTRAGERREVQWIQTALRGPDGELSHLVGMGQDVTDRDRAEARLRESSAQLRALAGRLQSVREEEKARLARDLHDELGQLLTGLKMDLAWLERRLTELPPSDAVSPLVDRVVAASELVDQTVASVQRIAAELRPGALDRLGLAPTLRQEVRRFQERTGLECDARLDDLSPEPPPEVATALYRICQEALTNVSRHAQAARVVVSLAAGPAALVLCVEDDGVGLEAARLGPEALGLVGMKERATLLGGAVEFTARPGGGTIVTARMPVAGAPGEAT